MTFLPIVERELRVAARRKGTYWMRAIVVLVVVIVSGWIFMINPGSQASEIGQSLFFVLTGGAGFYCLFAGVRTTADCLSEEKRDGTLGLLFLTNLRGYDIVLGKLAANSLGSIYGVLAIIPALGIPILLGGTSAGQFARVSVTLVATLLFSLAAGMAASACCRSSRKARALAFLFILCFTGGLPVLGAWLAYKWHGNMAQAFLVTSPVYAYIAGLDWQFLRMGGGYYWGIGTLVALSGGFLLLAAVVTPRSWQDRSVGSPRGRRLPGQSGSAAREVWFRRQSLAINPYFWLAARPQSRVLYVWSGFAVVGLIWLWGLIRSGEGWFNIGIYVATAFALNSMLKVWLASESCRHIAAERKQGTLELLLATPLSVREILDGQRLALQRQFALPIFLTLVVEALMLAALLRESGFSENERKMWASVWLLSMVLLLLDAAALFWFGLWQGLTARSARRAYTRIISAVLVLPWVLFAGFLGALGVGAFGPPYEISWKIFVAVWFGSGVLVSLACTFSARHGLMNEFRVRAANRFSTV